jgi:hypothetical protein
LKPGPTRGIFRRSPFLDPAQPAEDGPGAREWLDAFAKSFPDFIRWRPAHADLCQAQGSAS